MHKLEINAAVLGSLLVLSQSGLALAGDEAGQKGKRGDGGALAAQFFQTLDADKDGQVTRAEAEAAGQRFFERFDGDKNGEITREEAGRGAAAMRSEELDARFKQLDVNADARLTPQESKLPPPFFAKLDQNKDQVLTLEELRAAAPPGLGNGAGMFKHADQDGDGKVTRAEATRAVTFRFDQLDANRDGLITRAEIDERIATKGRGKGRPPRDTKQHEKK